MEIIHKIHNLFAAKVYADSLGQELTKKLGALEDDSIDSPDTLVESIVGFAVPLAIICVVILVVYASYILMSSQGNPDKLKEGKEILTNAIIGFLVILLSVAILLLISGALGLEIYS
jgi:hypothetical protein